MLAVGDVERDELRGAAVESTMLAARQPAVDAAREREDAAFARLLGVA